MALIDSLRLVIVAVSLTTSESVRPVVLLSGMAAFGARQIMFAVVKLNGLEVVEPQPFSAFTRQW